MTAVAFKPPPVALALLALAAVYYMTRRPARAVVGAGGVGSTLGKLFGANQAGTASTNAAARSYLVPTGNALRLPLASATQRTEASTISQGLSVLQSIVGLVRGNAGGTITAPNAPQYYGGEIFRPADFVPNYTPDTAGEAAAQSYFYSNPDEFISNPPASFVYNGGLTGGWLDLQ